MKSTYLFAMACMFFGSTSAVAQTVAITGGTIIDGTGAPPLADGVLIVDAGKIVAIGPKVRITVPAGAETIDAKGKYVIPGLIDANLHLIYGSYVENLVRYEDRFEGRIEEAAQVALKNGLTTVFDTWGPREPLVNVRDRINAGATIGSRIYLGGNIVGTSSPMGRDFMGGAEAPNASKRFLAKIKDMWEQGVGPELLTMTPEQVREKIRTYVGKDIDFLKFLVSGHGTPQGEFIAFSPEVMDIIIAEGRRAGLTVQTHTQTVESLRMAVDRNVDLMQHCDATGPTAIPDELVKQMATKKIPCAVLAFLLITEKRKTLLAAKYGNASSYPFQEVREANLDKMIKAGVPLILGTDSGTWDDADGVSPKQLRLTGDVEDNGVLLGQAHFVWLQVMIEHGMAPMDALMGATSRVAKAYRVNDKLGSLERGKIADVLVLDKNPLEAPENYKSISIVMKAGKVIDRAALPVNPLVTRKP